MILQAQYHNEIVVLGKPLMLKYRYDDTDEFS